MAKVIGWIISQEKKSQAASSKKEYRSKVYVELRLIPVFLIKPLLIVMIIMNKLQH